MVDYRKFLKSEPEEVAVLFLGGLTAHAFGGRALRLTSSVGLEPGWYRVRVRGRGAELLAPAEPESLEGLPGETGHFACGYVGMSRGRLELLERLGAPEPEALAPLRARRHPTGALLLDEALFEGEPEVLAREALEAGRGLSGVKGVTPSLRAAFALATARAVARERGVSLSAAELDKAIPRIADDGRAAAHALLDELTLRREEERARDRRAGSRRGARRDLRAREGDAARSRSARAAGPGRARRASADLSGSPAARRAPPRPRYARGALPIPRRALHERRAPADPSRLRRGDLPRRRG